MFNTSIIDSNFFQQAYQYYLYIAKDKNFQTEKEFYEEINTIKTLEDYYGKIKPSCISDANTKMGKKIAEIKNLSSTQSWLFALLTASQIVNLILGFKIRNCKQPT